MALKIPDYFFGVRPGQHAEAAAARAAIQTATGAFSRLLSRIGDDAPGTGSEVTGMTIVDYLSRPVAPIGHFVRPSSSGAPPAAGSADAPKDGTAGGSDIDDTASVPDGSPVATTPGTPAAFAERREHDRIERSVAAAARKYRLSRRLIRAVIRTESNFDPRAVSPAGAQGLMQLMPTTARGLGVTDPFDIGQNVDGGARYLRQMLDRFDGDLKSALAAYNAGPGTVERYQGRVPPYAETVRYVAKVMVEAGRTV